VDRTKYAVIRCPLHGFAWSVQAGNLKYAWLC
jgi:hypothetical protein